MEPLSAKRAEKTSAPKAEPADASREQKKAAAAQGKVRKKSSAPAAKKEAAAPVEDTSAEAAAPSGLKGMLFGKHKHVNAAELASEALGAAKKLET